MQNFFNDEIEKTVFISDEQLNDISRRKLYGKYFVNCKLNLNTPNQETLSIA